MIGRILITIDALGLILGAPIADYNHTHMFNPRWPPHAKFHNAQTIMLSVSLGLFTLWYTWTRGGSSDSGSGSAVVEQSVRSRRSRRRETALVTAFTGSVYWAAGLASILFPGTMGLDPEFGGPGFPQAKIFVGFAACGLAGSWVEWVAGGGGGGGVA